MRPCDRGSREILRLDLKKKNFFLIFFIYRILYKTHFNIDVKQKIVEFIT